MPFLFLWSKFYFLSKFSFDKSISENLFLSVLYIEGFSSLIDINSYSIFVLGVGSKELI